MAPDAFARIKFFVLHYSKFLSVLEVYKLFLQKEKKTFLGQQHSKYARRDIVERYSKQPRRPM